MWTVSVVVALYKRLRAHDKMDVVTALALGDWDAAERLLSDNPGVITRDGANPGALHLMAKRNNVAAVKWLLDHGRTRIPAGVIGTPR